MPEAIPETMILMVHKNFKDREPASVTARAFEQTWKDKGWQKYVAPPPTEKPSLAPASTPENSKGDDKG